jgi:hypothetical protein
LGTNSTSPDTSRCHAFLHLREERLALAAARLELRARIRRGHPGLVHHDPADRLGDRIEGGPAGGDRVAVEHYAARGDVAHERPGPKTSQAAVELHLERARAEAPAHLPHDRAVLRRGHEAVVGREHRDIAVSPDLLVEVAEEVLQRAIQMQHVIVRDARLRAVRMVDRVVRGQADREDVGGTVLPEPFAAIVARAKSSVSRSAKGEAARSE